MSQLTAIEWTDLSWNPVHGCSIVSTECRNCYAAAISQRRGHTTAPWTPANAAENVILKPHKLREPLSGAKAWQGLGDAAAAAGKTDGKLVFANSMSDLFHEQVPDEFIARVFAVMAHAERHTFQVLTKRPARMRELLANDEFLVQVVRELQTSELHRDALLPIEWPLPNVWLGVSIGLRQFVGRATDLRGTPAAVRFISAEPLLGPLLPRPGVFAPGVETWWPVEDRIAPALSLIGIDWLIAGAESGHGARPMNEQCVRDLRDACQAAGTAFFYKQSAVNGRKQSTPLLDGHRWTEFPEPSDRSSREGRARPGRQFEVRPTGDRLLSSGGRKGADAPDAAVAGTASTASGCGPSCARASHTRTGGDEAA